MARPPRLRLQQHVFNETLCAPLKSLRLSLHLETRAEKPIPEEPHAEAYQLESPEPPVNTHPGLLMPPSPPPDLIRPGGARNDDLPEIHLPFTEEGTRERDCSFSSNVTIESEMADRNELGDFFLYGSRSEPPPTTEDEGVGLFRSASLLKVLLPLKERVGLELRETEFSLEFDSFYAQAYWDAIGCYAFL